MMSTALPTVQRLSDTLDIWLAWLSSVTLGQIWQSVNYHPLPRTVTIFCLSLALMRLARRAGMWLYTYRQARIIQNVSWAEPQEASREWKGRVIEKPSLFSHMDDKSLLPSEAGTAGADRAHITCYDPSTAYHLTTLPLLSAAEVGQQIHRADSAQPTWAQTTFAQRQSFLRSLKAWILRDMDAIVDVACRDTGKIILASLCLELTGSGVDAVLGEILTVLSKIDWLLSYGEKTLSPDKRPTNLMLAHKVSHVHYQPLGTVLALVSWNYSFHNMISPIIAGLFAGNSVVVKCSEQVAWSSMWYMGGVRACLRACGMNEEVVQLVVCLPDVAETITRNPLVKHITFIGSEPVGKKVALAAAGIMVPTCIELGGKDPAFLLPSANLKQFASTWLRGAFQAAGQNCIGIELFLVPQNLLDDFLAIMLPRIQALRPGVDLSSLISHAPISRLQTILAQAEKQGARILTGGKPYSHPDHPHAAYFEPTLITDVTMDMAVAKEELFAPVMTVVPYSDVDEAVGWLKKSRFGLGGGVYGDDKEECRRVAQALECGMVSINDFGVFYLNQAMPFGGVKASGHGRFGGEEGLRSLCAVKAITEDRFFSFIRTPIPKPVDYPLPDGSKPYGFLDGLVKLIYGSGWSRIRGLIGLIRNA